MRYFNTLYGRYQSITQTVTDLQQLKIKLYHQLNFAGVLIGLCGTSSVRFRPSLVFKRRHADIVLDKLEMTLSSMIG